MSEEQLKTFSLMMSGECQSIHMHGIIMTKTSQDYECSSRPSLLNLRIPSALHRSVHCYPGINNTSNTPILNIPISDTQG